MELASSVCSRAPKSLPLELSRFAFSYLSKSLGLTKPVDPSGRPSIEELNRVLLDNLVEDKAGSALQTKGEEGEEASERASEREKEIERGS